MEAVGPATSWVRSIAVGHERTSRSPKRRERGSIPGQLSDCRDALARVGERIVAWEYSDEACSAYLGDRDPGPRHVP